MPRAAIDAKGKTALPGPDFHYQRNKLKTKTIQMLMDPMGGIVMTNDGNAILREITVEHPAAKSMIEISRTQDEEVGDGTTSVIVLGEHCVIKPICRHTL